jgi:protein-L-isoaspartate O-methyltransferase
MFHANVLFLARCRRSFIQMRHWSCALMVRRAPGVLAPLVLARMIRVAGVTSADRVLDVAGAGHPAVLSRASLGEVVALESMASLSSQAAANLAAGVTNVKVVAGSLDGASVSGPFDLIFVNGAVEDGIDPLLAKLAPGGRLIAVRKYRGPCGQGRREYFADRRGDQSPCPV